MRIPHTACSYCYSFVNTGGGKGMHDEEQKHWHFGLLSSTGRKREPKRKQFHWDERKEKQRQTFRKYISDKGCGFGLF